MSRAEIIFPYRRKENLFLMLLPPISGETLEPLEGVIYLPEEEEYGTRKVDLVDARPEAPTIQIPVSFTATSEELTRLIGTDELPTECVRGIVSVGCSITKSRYGCPLVFDGVESWSGVALLDKSDYAGVVQLIPELVRTRDQEVLSDGTATFAGAVIATGPAVEVILDRSKRPYTGPLAYKWEDFSKLSDKEHPWLYQRPNDVTFLDPRNVPRLYLNLRWPSLQPVLTGTARQGAPAALRNAYAAAIAHATWIELLLSSVATIRKDEDVDAFVPADGWKGQLARVIATKLYPDKSLSDALELIYEEYRDGDRAPSLIAQIGSIAHDHSKAGELMDKAARLLSRKLIVEETSE